MHDIIKATGGNNSCNITSVRSQVGEFEVHCPSPPQVRVFAPMRVYPVLQVKVAVIMKVVPEVVFTAPLERLFGKPQSTAVQGNL